MEKGKGVPPKLYKYRKFDNRILTRKDGKTASDLVPGTPRRHCFVHVRR
jgi:hypothetical protein